MTDALATRSQRAADASRVVVEAAQHLVHARRRVGVPRATETAALERLEQAVDAYV